MKKAKLFPAAFIAIISFLFTSCAITKNNIHQSVTASLDLSTATRPSLAPGETTGQTVGLNAGFFLTEDILKPDSNGRQTTKGNSFFSFSEGLELAEKGWQDNGNGLRSSVNIYYLELPVTANYNLRTNKDNLLHFGLGLYAAEALYGHYSTKYDEGGGYSGSFGFNKSQGTRSLDMGLRAVAGYSLSKDIDLYLSYDFGLYNTYLNDKPFKENIHEHNRSFGFNLAYRFK